MSKWKCVMELPSRVFLLNLVLLVEKVKEMHSKINISMFFSYHSLNFNNSYSLLLIFVEKTHET